MHKRKALALVAVLLLCANDAWSQQRKITMQNRGPKAEKAQPKAPGKPILKESKVWKGHVGRVLTVAISPDATTVFSGAIDKTLRVWPIGAGQPRQVDGFGKPFNHVRQIEFIPVVAKGKPAANLGIVLSGEELGLVDLRTGRGGKLSDAIVTVCVSPDGQSIAGSFHPDQSLLLWNARTGARLDRIQLQSTANAIAISPDSATVIVDTDQEALRSYELGTGQAAQRYKGQPGLVKVISFRPDGTQFVSAGHSPEVWLWDAVTAAIVHKFPGQERGVNDLAITADGKRLFVASEDGRIRVWDLDTRKKATKLAAHEGSIMSISVDQAGRWLATGGADETVRLFELSEP